MPSCALPYPAMMIYWGEIEVDGTERITPSFIGQLAGVSGTPGDVDKAMMTKPGCLMAPQVSAEVHRLPTVPFKLNGFRVILDLFRRCTFCTYGAPCLPRVQSGYKLRHSK